MGTPTVVGMPFQAAIKLLKVALGQATFTPLERALAQDELRRLEPPTGKKVSLDKPTGTAEKIVVDKTLEQASSVSAAPSWSVSQAHG